MMVADWILAEHLHEGEQPVYQLAALFGIYAFYSTQDKTLNRVRISIDPRQFHSFNSIISVLKLPSIATLDHLISLPESLAEFVDFRPTILPPSNPTPSVVRLITSESSTLQVVPSLDITYVVHTLLANEVFYIIPSETFLFPPSPQVTIEDPKLPARAEARRKLGVLVEEMERLKKAEIRPDTNYKGMTTVSYKTDPAVDWTTHLIDLEKKYAEHKATSVESLISNPLGNFQHSYAKGLVEGAKKKTLGHMRNLQADSGGEGGGRVDLANSLMGGGTDFLGLIGSGMKEYEEIMGELNRDLVAAGGPAIDLGGDEMELDIVETE